MRALKPVAVALLLALGACAAPPPPIALQPPPQRQAAVVRPPPAAIAGRVSGTVFYRERVLLPLEVEMRVRVVPLDTPAGPALAEQVVPNAGRVPVSFDLRVDPARIDPRQGYGVVAAFVRDGRVLFETEAPVPVLTRGRASSDVDVLVRRARATAG